ncbi:hypothetical protein FMEAI12_3940007 [Parafrankia sp. Ea1.12]|nr:hypothetical protein FMEAI12_3940007 [Parafrankia sp. Ea1.12]
MAAARSASARRMRSALYCSAATDILWLRSSRWARVAVIWAAMLPRSSAWPTCGPPPEPPGVSLLVSLWVSPPRVGAFGSARAMPAPMPPPAPVSDGPAARTPSRVMRTGRMPRPSMVRRVADRWEPLSVSSAGVLTLALPGGSPYGDETGGDTPDRGIVQASWDGLPALWQPSVGTLVTTPHRNCMQLYSHGSTPNDTESPVTSTLSPSSRSMGRPINRFHMSETGKTLDRNRSYRLFGRRTGTSAAWPGTGVAQSARCARGE